MIINFNFGICFKIIWHQHDRNIYVNKFFNLKGTTFISIENFRVIEIDAKNLTHSMVNTPHEY